MDFLIIDQNFSSNLGQYLILKREEGSFAIYAAFGKNNFLGQSYTLDQVYQEILSRNLEKIKEDDTWGITITLVKKDIQGLT